MRQKYKSFEEVIGLDSWPDFVKRMRMIGKKKKTVQYYARNKVAYARKKGLLIKSPCVICGDNKSEAHHHDYNDPLNITWVCKNHHVLADKVKGNNE